MMCRNVHFFFFQRFVLPEIRDDVSLINGVLEEICVEQDLEYVRYNLPLQHLAMDGLHVRPAGAKHLLFTILGKVKRKYFAPAAIKPSIPQTIPTDSTLDPEEWPPLPTTCLAVKKAISDEPAWTLAVVGSCNSRTAEEQKVIHLE